MLDGHFYHVEIVKLCKKFDDLMPYQFGNIVIEDLKEKKVD
jgi:hypothetical protein